MVCRLGISISKDRKSPALGQRKCSMVRPLIPSNCFINTSEPQNKHTNNILRVMQDFCHIMHLVCGGFSLFTPLLESDLYFVDEV